MDRYVEINPRLTEGHAREIACELDFQGDFEDLALRFERQYVAICPEAHRAAGNRAPHRVEDAPALGVVSTGQDQWAPQHRAAIMASEIERLADLEGFLKFASTLDWMRVRLEPASYAKAPKEAHR